MREIKFRGKDINGNWHYGNLAVLKEDIKFVKRGTYISNSIGQPFAYQVRYETVGQYIGLHDDDGTEVYEGDILDDVLKIEYGTTSCGCCSFVHGYDLENNNPHWGIGKVTGNIYE